MLSNSRSEGQGSLSWNSCSISNEKLFPPAAWGFPVQDQELDSTILVQSQQLSLVILVGPSQLSIFHSSVPLSPLLLLHSLFHSGLLSAAL